MPHRSKVVLVLTGAAAALVVDGWPRAFRVRPRHGHGSGRVSRVYGAANGRRQAGFERNLAERHHGQLGS